MSEGHRTPALTGVQIDHILQAMADSFGQQLRSPILHSPAEQDLNYQDVTFRLWMACLWRAGSCRVPGPTS